MMQLSKDIVFQIGGLTFTGSVQGCWSGSTNRFTNANQGQL